MKILPQGWYRGVGWTATAGQDSFSMMHRTRESGYLIFYCCIISAAILCSKLWLTTAQFVSHIERVQEDIKFRISFYWDGEIYGFSWTIYFICLNFGLRVSMEPWSVLNNDTFCSTLGGLSAACPASAGRRNLASSTSISSVRSLYRSSGGHMFPP